MMIGHNHVPTGGNLNVRRQKRLERNRKSTRLSRRKQYLEVLEERVTFLSEEMDRGRREHVLNAVRNYNTLRAEVLKDTENYEGTVL